MRGWTWAMWLALGALAGCSGQAMPDAAEAPRATPPATPPATSVGARKEKVDERRCTDEPKPDERDKRPRCGGAAPAQPYAYKITLDNGESFTVCDISKPFMGSIGGGLVTLTFLPSSDSRGTVSWRFAHGKGVVDTAYDYALRGTPEKMTGIFRANSPVCGKAMGGAACAQAKTQTFTSTWIRLGRCQPSGMRHQ